MTTGRINQVSTFHEPDGSRSCPTGPCPRSRRSGKVCISKREKVQQLQYTVEADFHQPTIGTISLPSHTQPASDAGSFLPCHSDTVPSAMFNHSEVTLEPELSLSSQVLRQSRLRRDLPVAGARRYQPQILPLILSITPKSALRVSVQASHHLPSWLYSPAAHSLSIQ